MTKPTLPENLRNLWHAIDQAHVLAVDTMALAVREDNDTTAQLCSVVAQLGVLKDRVAGLRFGDGPGDGRT